MRAPSAKPRKPPAIRRKPEPIDYARLRRAIIPRTLIPTATAADQASTITLMRAGIKICFTCYARQMARYARQITEGLSAAAAVAAWTEVPEPAGPLAEVTLSESAPSEEVHVERVFATDAYTV